MADFEVATGTLADTLDGTERMGAVQAGAARVITPALLKPYLLASSALTGAPTAPTAAAGTSSTQLATTAFVMVAIANLVASSPAALDTLNELATALGNDPNFATSMATALGLKAPLASPTFTGTVTVPTAPAGDATTKAASTAFVAGLLGTAAFNEAVQDQVGALFAAGTQTGITVTYDDAGNAMNLTVTGGGGGGSSSPTNMPRSDKAANYSVVAADAGKTIRADTSGGAINITLPASMNADGDYVAIRKFDASTNRVTILLNDGTTNVAWLGSQRDEIVMWWANGVWIVKTWRIQPQSFVFTANGTFTKPPLALFLDVEVIDGGGGGGGGCGGDNTAARAGGGAGGCGGVARFTYPASVIGATETVTIGQGGAGGAGSTGGATASSGSTGTSSSFGSWLTAKPGFRGVGGSATGGSGGTPGLSFDVTVATSAAAQTATKAGAGGGGGTAQGANGSRGSIPELGGGPGGGGGGGGLSTASVEAQGGAGGGGHNAGGQGLYQTGLASNLGGGGNGGPIGSGAATGGQGNAPVTANSPFYGDGGGGGGSTSGATGGAGGTGGAPGGGGGGGAAARTTGGAGGNGARGEVRITARFS